MNFVDFNCVVFMWFYVLVMWRFMLRFREICSLQRCLTPIYEYNRPKSILLMCFPFLFLGGNQRGIHIYIYIFSYFHVYIYIYFLYIILFLHIKFYTYILYTWHTYIYLFMTHCVLLVALWNSGGGAVENGNGSLAAGCLFWMQLLGVLH